MANSQPNDPDNDTMQVYTGVSGRDKSWYSYFGSINAINGILDRSGFRFDFFLGYGKYKYADPQSSSHNGIISNVNLGPGNPLQNFRLDKYFGLFEGYAETLRGNCSDFRQIDQY